MTKRLVLRRWQDSDLEQFIQMAADPKVMAYIGDGSLRTSQQSTATFRLLQEGWGSKPFGLFAIELLKTGEFIGFCGLSEPEFLPEILPSVELGWRLRSSAWGQGFATEAAAATIDWAFDTLQHDHLVSIIHADNTDSHKLATRLGMQRRQRTVIPKNASWVDVYRLERTAWSESDEN